MDRVNLMAPDYSHVLSSTNDLEELDQLRRRVGAPPQAFHLGDGRRPHLDLKWEPRERALSDAAVVVLPSTRELLLRWRQLRANHYG